MFDSKSEEISVLFGSWSHPPGLGGTFRWPLTLVEGAEVKVVGLQWKS